MKRLARRQRKLTIGEKRKLAAGLRRQGKSFSEIGAVLGVSPIRARDLSIQHERIAAANPRHGYWMELSSRAMTVLLCGSAAVRFGRTIDARYERLPEIAAAYTRRELLEEESVGSVTCDEIETWLVSKGSSLRPEALDAVELFAQAKRRRARQTPRKRRVFRQARRRTIELPTPPASFPKPARSLH